MRRYWVDHDPKKDEEIRLHGPIEVSGDRFHHIFDVCRQKVGSKFEVLTGNGKAYFVEVRMLHKKSATLVVLEEREVTPLPKPHIHIVQSLPKFSVFDSLLEKLVELGVASVIPVYSEFSFAKSLKDKEKKKLERWERIIESASQQSGRGEKMKISAPRPIGVVLNEINRNANASGLFPYEGESSMGARMALKKLNASELTDIYVVVGSEGGFSRQEVQEFQRLGLEPFTLGAQVLRVETACVAITSVLKYELGFLE